MRAGHTLSFIRNSEALLTYGRYEVDMEVTLIPSEIDAGDFMGLRARYLLLTLAASRFTYSTILAMLQPFTARLRHYPLTISLQKLSLALASHPKESRRYSQRLYQKDESRSFGRRMTYKSTRHVVKILQH